MIKRPLKALATICDDFLLIIKNPHSARRKWALARAYIKISFIHYFLEKVVNLKNVTFLDFTVETFNYYNFYFLFKEIFIRGDYFVAQECKNVLDCGANIGMATLYFKWLWPKATVVCFEPDKATYDVLMRNIARNHLDGVQSFNVALSDTDGELTFNVSHDNPGSLKMSLFKERFGDGESYKVKAVDFSRFLAHKVDLVKMDIEGAEFVAMKRALEAGVLKNARMLILEYHHNIPGESRTFSSFLKMFEDSGYSYNLESRLEHYQARNFQDILIRFQLN